MLNFNAICKSCEWAVADRFGVKERAEWCEPLTPGLAAFSQELQPELTVGPAGGSRYDQMSSAFMRIAGGTAEVISFVPIYRDGVYFL